MTTAAEFKRLALQADAQFDVYDSQGTESTMRQLDAGMAISADQFNAETHQNFAVELAEGYRILGLKKSQEYLSVAFHDLADTITE